MSDEHHQERAKTEDLVEMPATPENMNAKLNYLVTHMYLTERLCEKSAQSSEASRVAAEVARTSANNAAEHALKAMQSREPLSRTERFGTVFGGAAIGGLVAQLALWALGIGSIAAIVSSCH